jgi:hypothetical protein
MARRWLAVTIAILIALLAGVGASTPLRAQQTAAGMIAYTKPLASGAQQLKLVKPDGTGDRPLHVDLDSTVFPAWSRDGQWLAVMGLPLDSNDSTPWNVFVFRPTGEDLLQVTTLNASGQTLLPLFKAFAPDGRRLAVSAVGQAQQQDPNRGEVTTNVATLLVDDREHPGQQTTIGGVTDVGGSLQGVGVDWSPTEDLLIVPAATLEDSSGLPLPVTALFAVPPVANAFSQGLARPVTSPQRALDRTADDAMPAFSPDGQRVAFVRRETRGQRFTASIRVVNLDGSGEQEVVGLPQGDVVNKVSWSGDGKSLVFDWGRPQQNVVFSDPGTTGLWTIGVDGSNLTQLRDPPALYPAWSWAK